MEIIDNIKFSNISEVLIEHFHEKMDHLKVCQLVVSSIHANREEQPCVSLVDYLVVTELTKCKKERKTITKTSAYSIQIIANQNLLISFFLMRYFQEIRVLSVSVHNDPIDFSL